MNNTEKDADFPPNDPLHALPPQMRDAFTLASTFMPDRVTLVERLYLAYLNKEPSPSNAIAMAEIDAVMFKRAEIVAANISGMPMFHCWGCIEAKIYKTLKRYNFSLDTIESKKSAASVIVRSMMEHAGESDEHA